MPDTPSIVIVKRFDYRGAPEEFSNKYHFLGDLPVNKAAWIALADKIINLERPCVSNKVEFIRAYGYEAGVDHSIAQIDYEEAPLTVKQGTFDPTGTRVTPGDAAIVIKFPTGELNSRGKQIYCWKYMHDVYGDLNNADLLSGGQRTAYQNFAEGMCGAAISVNWRYCGPQGATLENPDVSWFITTRTLKRRGKRPLP